MGTTNGIPLGTANGIPSGTANGIPRDPLGVLVDALLTLLLGVLVLARRLARASPSPRAFTEPCCDAFLAALVTTLAGGAR